MLSFLECHFDFCGFTMRDRLIVGPYSTTLLKYGPRKFADLSVMQVVLELAVFVDGLGVSGRNVNEP